VNIRITGICLPGEFVWQYRNGDDRMATRCDKCDGLGYHGTPRSRLKKECVPCQGGGWHGIDPAEPTDCRPVDMIDGEMVHARVAVYQVRYALGWPIWHPEDLDIRPEVRLNPDRTYPRIHANYWE
jgi:hypothetical protein